MIYFVGGIVSLALLDAQIQPWANIDIKEAQKEAQKEANGESSEDKNVSEKNLEKLPGKTVSF